MEIYLVVGSDEGFYETRWNIKPFRKEEDAEAFIERAKEATQKHEELWAKVRKERDIYEAAEIYNKRYSKLEEDIQALMEEYGDAWNTSVKAYYIESHELD